MIRILENINEDKTIDKKEKIIHIKVNDSEKQLAELLADIKNTASMGHTFDVIVDPDCDKPRTYEMDGDGSFKIKDIDESPISEEFTEDFEVSDTNQKYTSAKTSINSSKLPAIFKLVSFKPGTINLDFGGGKFDNAAEELAKNDVINLVYDPYNRNSSHNNEVLNTIRKNGGADSVTCSNVLNVIAEPEARQTVIKNIYNLAKSGAPCYWTVYEGSGSGEGGETKSGYQLNKKTADYLEEIQQVFPDAKRKGKLIVATK